MVKQLVNTGTLVNDGTGDTLRVAFTKINENTTELYDDIASLNPLTINLTIFTANGTALNNNINLVNTAASRTITAPLTTVINSKFTVVDITGQAFTNNITVVFTSSRLFSTINDTFIINVNKASITFIYVNSTIGWITI